MARSVGVLLLAVALAFGSGWPALRGGLIRDDLPYVDANPHVTQPVSLGLLLAVPFQPEHSIGLYRPVTTASFRLDYIATLAFGLPCNLQSAPWFHGTNFALAGLAAWLLWCLARRAGLPAWLAASAAALFAVHPARTEAVHWISGRAECLLTAFALAALVVAAGGARRWRGPTAALLAVLAFYSKEQGAVLAVLIPLLPGLTKRDRLHHLLWTGTALVVAFAWRWHVLGDVGPTGNQQVLEGTTLLERVPHSLHVTSDYLRMMLWPRPLLNEYDDPAATPALLQQLPGLAFLALAAWLLWRRRDWPAFAAGLFLLPLGPVVNLLYRTGEIFAERFLALPSAGAVLLAVLGLRAVPRPLAATLAILAVGAGAALSFARGHDYADEDTLTRAQRRDAPQLGASDRLRARYLQYRAQTQTDAEAAQQTRLEALSLLREAARKSPHNATVRLDLAKAQLGAGDTEAAVSHARWVSESSPDNYAGPSLLGQALLQTDDLDAAAAAFRASLRLEPTDLQAALGLVSVLRKQDRVDEVRARLETTAAMAAEMAERRWWHPEAPRIQALLAYQLGRDREALTHLGTARARCLGAERMVTLTEETVRILRERGAAPRANAAIDRVLAEVEPWLETRRPRAEVCAALARLQRLRGRRPEAQRWFTEALDATDRPEVRARLELELQALRR
ncbi:MAG: tetratricopeptide repeat protein [Planctomycetota bacterium]